MRPNGLTRGGTIDFEVFPASVSGPGLGDEVINPARVIVSGDVLYVFVAPDNRRVVLGAKGSVQTFEKAPRPRLDATVITTPEGRFEVRAIGGCGCGHPLRSMNVEQAVAEAKA